MLVRIVVNIVSNHKGEKNSADRRSVIKGLAAGGVISLSGLGVVTTPVAAESGTSFTDPSWEEPITVEQDVGNNLFTNLVYAFSELNTKIVDGETVDRYSHFFQLSTVGHSAPVDPYTPTYNISEQSFKATDTDDAFSIEFNEINDAGASAWPNPDGGNWDEVLKVILETAVSEASTIVDLGLTATEIYEAYQKEGFSTDDRDTIEYERSYAANKVTSSHSVDFTIDTIPSTFPTAEISSRISDDAGFDIAEGTFNVDFTYEAKEPSKSVDSSAGTDDEEKKLDSDSSSSNDRMPAYSELSDMSDQELADLGITKVQKSDIESAKQELEKKQKQVTRERSAENDKDKQSKSDIQRQLKQLEKAQSKLSFDDNGQTYVKKFPVNVTTESYTSDSNIIITER